MKSFVKKVGAGLQGTGYDVTIGQTELTWEYLEHMDIPEDMIATIKKIAFLEPFEDGEIEFFIYSPLKIDYRVKAAKKKRGE